MLSLVRRFRIAAGGLIGAAVLVVAIAGSGGAAVGTNDYPYRGTVNLVDPWGFYTGYCTSFVAWRLSQLGIRMHAGSWTGPNGVTARFGNGGNWDAAARAVGLVVDTHPAPGSVAVWHSYEGGAWNGGHVAYVMAVDGSGRAIVEEYNWTYRFGYDQRATYAPRYIHFRATAPAPAPAPQPIAYHTYRTTAVVNERRGPGLGYAIAGQLASGATINIVCQTRSASAVNGTTIWDRLTNGLYVTDYYTTTPVYNQFTPGIPQC